MHYIGLLIALVAAASHGFTIRFNLNDTDRHNDDRQIDLHHNQNDQQTDNYVIVFHDHVDHIETHASLTSFVSVASASNVHRGIHKKFNVDNGPRGVFAHLDTEAAEQLRAHPGIKYIERDGIYRTQETEHMAPWGLGCVQGIPGSTCGARWCEVLTSYMDIYRRISHRKLPSYSLRQDYIYDKHQGKGVTAYVIDTGVNIHHEEFEGRAVWGTTIPEDEQDEDENGHGTHVAGTIGGKTYGVAKKSNIVVIKVLRSDGSGTLSDVISGVEWAVKNHTARIAQESDPEAKKKIKSVLNMSLGGSKSPTLDSMVDAAVSAGIYVAVAAGNEAMDACNNSPAASKKAITVGATTVTDDIAWFSNHGRCVDILAPGDKVLSAWIHSNVSTNTMSGTSMASPHVTGLLALLLSEPKYADLSPREMKHKVVKMSTKGVIKEIPSGTHTANRLAWTDPPKY